MEAKAAVKAHLLSEVPTYDLLTKHRPTLKTSQITDNRTYPRLWRIARVIFIL